LLRDDLDALDAWAAEVLPSVRANPTGALDTAALDTAAPIPVINSPVATPERGSGRVDHGRELDGLDVTALGALPRGVRTRVLRAWATEGGAGPLTAERTAALDGLVTAWRGQGPIELSGGVSVRRVSGRLELSREQTREGP
jgi:tRNA(Ile)-lysidine synthase